VGLRAAPVHGRRQCRLRPDDGHLQVTPIDVRRRAPSRLAGIALAIRLGFITTVPVFLDNGLPLPKVGPRCCAARWPACSATWPCAA
jgi:hypothetical protein